MDASKILPLHVTGLTLFCFMFGVQVNSSQQPDNRYSSTVETSSDTRAGQTKGVLQGRVFDNTGLVEENFMLDVRSEFGNAADDKQVPTLTVTTDAQGYFSAKLPLGSYKVCPRTFSKLCRTVLIAEAPQPPPYVEFKLNLKDEDVPPGWLNIRLATIAGEGAQNCGRVGLKENPAQATKCALKAFRRREAFYVRYDDVGLDSDTSSGIAGDSEGRVYIVNFDGMGIDSHWLPPGATMPDGYHTLVIPCSMPVRLNKTPEGHLTCHWSRE
ncbi:MAG TPA: hypothetical protein VFK06_17950 [Candidatus Angelobacter sp.]|nr:hypothetical protein [Candidatus Angelobacter sp.]